MRRTGFTWAQYLVVLSVLFIGAPSVLFVWLTARNPHFTSRRSLCKSNLRQLEIAFAQYYQDADEHFPLVAGVPPSSSQTGDGAYGWGDAIFVYVKTPMYYQCPAEKIQGDEEHKAWESGYTDYYLNNRLAGRSLYEMENPMTTVVLGEGNDGLDINDARYAHSAVPPVWLKEPSSPANRHTNGANYLFLDGHTKWLPAANAPGNGKHRQGYLTFLP